MAPRIFFHLSESCVNLPSLEWLQNWEKSERVDTGIPVLSHPPFGSSHHAQANHFPLSYSNLMANNSPNPQRDSALHYVD